MPGETKFTWHLERWTCKAQKDMYVYYNKVEADAGVDIYTCDEHAKLNATTVDATKGFEGHWERVSADSPISIEEPTNSKTNVSGLKQGDNQLIWVVENKTI